MSDGDQAPEPLTAEEIRALKALARPDTARALLSQAAFLIRIARGKSGASGEAGGSGGGAASDAELRGQYSDPSIKKDPKRWAGASYAGCHYSECPSDYLLVLAEFLEWKAEQEKKKPEPKKHRNGKSFFWEFDLQNARLARGWARRNEGLEKLPPVQPEVGDGGSDASGEATSSGEEEIPF